MDTSGTSMNVRPSLQEAGEKLRLIAESRRLDVIANNVEAAIDRAAVVISQRIAARDIDQQREEARG